jgi:cysteinyl-tRNA synthetase
VDVVADGEVEGIADMSLRVYNTLTRQKEPFPKGPGEPVTMYVCGPTVYKPSHIGHMVGPVIFDTVKRYLTYLGYPVTWVVNITDVDDKLINRANELGTTVKDLAEKMTADYVDCLKKLNVTGIDRMPKATEHIPGMIAMIGGLIEKGYAYPAGGDVYFDITRDEDYGKLCNRDPEQLEAGARIEVSDRKRNPGDFALWKGAKPGEPAWESPWGKGRPGWHIECSVMSMEYLGETLDIHGGGLDLQFPHHENELAQSESFTGKPFSRVWMHNGLLKMGHAKMAGSVGNVVNIADLLQRHHPETVRFLLLATHYRSPIEYSDERLIEVSKALERFYEFFRRYERITGENFYSIKSIGTLEDHETAKSLDPHGRLEGEMFYSDFRSHMDDDFNTGGAVGKLFDLVTSLNRLAGQYQEFENAAYRESVYYLDFKRGATVLRELSSILGLFWAPLKKSYYLAGETGHFSLTGGAAEFQVATKEQRLVETLAQIVTELGTTAPAADVDSLMQQLIQLRADARKAKNFAVADQIRKRLGELNVTLEDRPGGKTDWRVG